MTRSAPMLVRMLTDATTLTRQYLAVSAFEGGTADAGDFDVLLDCADMLLLGAHVKACLGEKEVAHMARMALANVRDRYVKTRRLGVTGEERKALRVLVEISEDFWKRQPVERYNEAVMALKAYRKGQ